MTDSILAWSQTAGDNGAADATINWAEFQTPASVNDSARAMMARVAQLISDMAPKRSSTGSANAYVVASDAAGAALRDGEQITFIPNHTNTAACTINVDGRGAKSWRPAPSTDFSASNILSGVPVTAFYRSSTDEWLSPGTGYYVTSMASGVALQSITARLPQIGDLTISYAPTPGAGRIRLTEATQSVLKSSYPELNSYLSGISYPWGSTATHFSLPPAAGYALRFAATTSTIDTSGARTAGSTQSDQNKAHTHAVAVTGTAAAAGAHSHTIISISDNQVGADGSGAAAYQTSRFTTAAPDHTHTVSATGTAATDGGDEVRVKNVAFHLDVVASTALSASQIAVFGFPLQWDTGTTAANPGAARIRCNNATPSSATAFYASTTDGWGVDISGVYASLGEGSLAIVSKVGAQATRLVLQLSSAPVAGSGFYTFTGTLIASGGTLASNDQLALECSASSTGAQGDAGFDGGLSWQYSQTTIMADPSAGKFRLNSLTMASVTAMAIADGCGETGNPDASAYVLSWDDSTNTTNYGTLILKSDTSDGVFAVFSITGSSTDNSGWTQLVLTYVTHAGTFTTDDYFTVQFNRSGNKGADGGGAGDVTAGAAFATDNRLIRSDGTAKGVQASGVTLDDSDHVSGMASLTLTNTGLHLLDTNATHDLIVAPGSNLTADRTLTITTGDADRTLTLPIPSTDVVWTPTGTGTTASSAGAYFAREVWFEDYGGSTGASGATNSTAMTNFIARLVATQSIGRVGPGIFTFSDEITIVDNNVHIIGQGAKNSIFPTSGSQGGTCFKYAGSTTATKAVVRFAPTTASNTIQSGCRLEGVALDADSKAGYGLALGSTNGGTFRDISAYGYTTGAMLCYAVASASVTYTLNNTIENFWGIYGSDAASGIVMIGPLAIANDGGRACAFNLFKNVHITHKDGFAYYLVDGDDNTFIECSASRAASGTGFGLWLGAVAAQTGAAYGNRFYGFVCAATPTGTASPIRSAVDGAYAPKANHVTFTAVDGNPVVTVDAGSSLWYTNLGGYTLGSHQPYSVQMPTKFTTYNFTSTEPPVVAEIADAGTNSIVYPEAIQHATTGTATTSFGVGRKAIIENASGTMKDAALDVYYWSDATAASEDTIHGEYLMAAGAAAEIRRSLSSGQQYFPLIATTASAANAFLNSGSSPANELMRSTSSARYKRDVEGMDLDRARLLLKARPVWYRSNIETDNQNHGHWGLIAEELADIDPRLVQYGYTAASWDVQEKDGLTVRVLKPGAERVPDGIAYDRMSAVLLRIIQDQDTRIAALEAARTT